MLRPHPYGLLSRATLYNGQILANPGGGDRSGPSTRTLAGPYSPGGPLRCVAPVTPMRHQIETVIAHDCPIWPDALSERFR